eukprot:60067-Prorocentrum_minimum.AAC.1
MGAGAVGSHEGRPELLFRGLCGVPAQDQDARVAALRVHTVRAGAAKEVSSQGTICFQGTVGPDVLTLNSLAKPCASALSNTTHYRCSFENRASTSKGSAKDRLIFTLNRRDV